LKITYAGRGQEEFVRSLTTDSTTSNLEGYLTVHFTAPLGGIFINLEKNNV
jgi:hypothetical protein